MCFFFFFFFFSVGFIFENRSPFEAGNQVDEKQKGRNIWVKGQTRIEFWPRFVTEHFSLKIKSIYLSQLIFIPLFIYILSLPILSYQQIFLFSHLTFRPSSPNLTSFVFFLKSFFYYHFGVWSQYASFNCATGSPTQFL